MNEISMFEAYLPFSERNLVDTDIIKAVKVTEVRGVDIHIRKAQRADVEEIWELLHSESKSWSSLDIINSIAHLYVITDSDKVVAVMLTTTDSDRVTPEWIVVHPMYPEGSVSKALYYSFFGVLKRQPE